MDKITEGEKHTTNKVITVEFRVPVKAEWKKEGYVKCYSMPLGVKRGKKTAKSYLLGLISGCTSREDERKTRDDTKYWMEQYAWLSLLDRLGVDSIVGDSVTMRVVEVEEEKVVNKK